MRKTLFLFIMVLASIGLAWGQTTINFDDAAKWTPGSVAITSYAVDHSYVDGLFSATGGPALRNTTSLQDGFAGAFGTYSWRLSNTATVDWIMTIASGGVSTFSLKIRRWDGTPTPDYNLEYSINGGTDWTLVTVINNTNLDNISDWKLFEGTINDSSSNLKIRLKANGTTERIMVDDFTWTSAGGSPTPTISVNPTTLTGFSYIAGAGPSATQTFSISGTNLTNNISIAASTNYEISLAQSTGYTTPITLTQTGGTVAATTIYVRLKAGLTAGSYNSEAITASSSGAGNQTVTCSGTVAPTTPTIVVNPTTLSGFTYVVGAGPSATQTFSVSGSGLTANISIAASTNYEISQAQASGYTTPITLTQTGGVVNATTIYVRLKAGLAVGDYNSELITASSTGAANQTVTCSGTVTLPIGPTTFLEENFDYTASTLLTANGWTAHSGAGTNPFTVSNTALSYPNYSSFSGLCAQTGGTTGEDVNRLFTAQTSGSIYASVLVNLTSASTAGDYFFHLGANPIGSDFKGRIFAQSDASNMIRFGISRAGAFGTAIWTDYVYSLNTTYLLVLKYTIVSGATNDEAYLWVNPVIGSVEPAYNVASADVAAADAANIGSVALRQASTNNPTPMANYDGIRVTNSWAQLWVTPPTPVIIVSATELDPLVCIVGTPSDETRSYNLSGTDINGNITITPPDGFQVSLTGTDGWVTSLSVAGTFDGLIYVRLLGTALGDYDGYIVQTSSGATPVSIHVTGEAIPPAVVWNIPASITAFSGEAGTPTAAQFYTLSATGASADLIVTTTAPFELSANGTSGWADNLSFASTYNGNVYVRMNATSAGDFNTTINHNTTNSSEGQVAVSGTATPGAGMAVDLFFSEYIEGNSNNKALEIFNGTGAAVDLSDYKVELYANGAVTPGNTLTMTGTLAHGDVYVIANSSANASILALSDVTATVTFFNGDDALALKKISTDSYIDIFGVIGQDPDLASTPTLGWIADGGYATVNKTLVRKPNVSQGISVNPTITGPNVNTDFVTLGTEWDVYPIDTISYLGTHTFNPGGNPMAATPTFNPPAGLCLNPINVTISSATAGATIYYTTNGDVPDNNSTPYSIPIAISTTTTIKAIAYATGYDPSAVALAIYTFPMDVPNIAALRVSTPGATVYRVTGEAILTFQQATRHQKYIQDASAAILIDDPSGIITSTYALYDGITGVTGTLALYNGLLQFTPIADPGAATSSGNVVVPAVRTLASITTEDQAKLLKILNVTVDSTLGNFSLTLAENINVTDASGTIVMRTFPATDYAGTAIPTAPVDIVCLGGQYQATMQISPRFLADITVASGTLEAPILQITQSGGTVTITWASVAGASSYIVESSDDPYTGFTLVTTTASLSYSGAATAKKFYRVKATN